MMNFQSIVFLILTFLVQIAELSAQTTISGSIIHKGLTRKYRLHLPPVSVRKTKAPLVFNFHGFTSNAGQQELLSGMNVVSDTAGFLVCYPDGINASWNVGWVFGSTADDIGFVSSLIDHLNENYSIDLNHVYACGMSNGGFMSYRLACELPDRIAAIASVTGSMVPGAIAACKPGRPVPVMEIHGTADNIVNYNGTPAISTAIPDVLRFWQSNNGCNQEPIKTPLPNINNTDGTTAEKWDYTSCQSQGQLVHFRIINGTHSWPGTALQAQGTSQDINASQEIWHFFSQQSLGLSSGSQSETPEWQFEAFPNPSSGVMNINIDHEGTYKVTIYTMAGQNLADELVLGGVATLDLSSLPSGTYMMQIKDNHRLATVKWVKL